ncbi:MAG: hypothetical protein HY234_08105 [Acidobacteria bacterium]|nr:hypothetical protein [Acidobacteriota bacterium]MBI3662994.1 hypothetical protein [Acidobacteriota bacterium]
MTKSLRQILSKDKCENPSCSSHGKLFRGWLDRREGIRLQGRWYCSPQCLEQAIADLWPRVQPAAREKKPRTHRIPLGLVLLSRGLIDNDALRAALEAQRKSGEGRLGHWLRDIGAATEQQITAALAIQWSCPVFPMDSGRHIECADLVPLPVLEAARMVPVHYLPGTRHLYLAFSDGVDYTSLYAVERMLDCRTEPCMADESALHRAMEEVRHEHTAPEVVFDRIADIAQVAATTRSYAAKLDAQDIRIVACGEYLWVKLQAGPKSCSLLFRVISRIG